MPSGRQACWALVALLRCDPASRHLSIEDNKADGILDGVVVNTYRVSPDDDIAADGEPCV